MYADFFGFTETPFSIAPDPGYLYMSESHREALAHLLYGLQTDGGFVLLTGEVGTGKTTICKSLFTRIPESVDLAFILNPKITVIELLETICDELHIAKPWKVSTKSLVDKINGHLLDTNARGRKTVLIIDEAQNLSVDVLEQLRLLTNLETDKRKLLQIILLGQPELRDMINRPQLRQLAQRVTARYHLGPLNRQDIAGYIFHRIQVAGGQENVFTDRAMKLVHQKSLGIPRLINLICDRALLGAYTRQQGTVTPTIVRQACHEIFDTPKRKHSLPWMLATLVCFVIIAGLTYSLLSPPAATDQVTGQAATAAQVTEQVAKVPISKPQPVAPPPAAPAPAAAPSPPPLARVWPADFGFGTTMEDAFTDLADMWGLSYQPGRSEPCDFAREVGLRCYDRQEDINSLRALDRPAVLSLYDDQGRPFYVILTRLDGNRAEFHAAGQTVALDIAALQTRWFGEYRILWYSPLDYSGVVHPGSTAKIIPWLAQALQSADLYPDGKAATRLEGTLLGALKQFQFSAGLTPDGVLGPKTVIHLNKAMGAPGPRLHSREVN